MNFSAETLLGGSVFASNHTNMICQWLSPSKRRHTDSSVQLTPKPEMQVARSLVLLRLQISKCDLFCIRPVHVACCIYLLNLPVALAHMPRQHGCQHGNLMAENVALLNLPVEVAHISRHFGWQDHGCNIALFNRALDRSGGSLQSSMRMTMAPCSQGHHARLDDESCECLLLAMTLREASTTMAWKRLT